MFDAIREGKAARWLTIAIFSLIILSFALWGVETYTSRIDAAGDLAKVGGQSISQQEFSEALRNRQDQLRAQLGGAWDPAMADRPEFRQGVLDGIVNQRVLIGEAARSGVSVSDRLLAEEIARIPAFQDENGKFSKAQYEARLRREGMAPALFESRYRQELAVQAMQQTVTGAPLVAAASVDGLLKMAEQTREVSLITLKPEQFIAQVKMDDAAVKKYYDEHQAEFTVPDQARVEFLVLSADKLAGEVALSDDEIKKLYEERSAQFRQAEERQASHILIQVAKDAPEDKRKAARGKAEELAKQARAAPERFAELAEKNSDDPGSKKQGGDLGFFGRGMMVKPFEDAVFAMSKGEIRGPVESDFGFHVIRLTDVHAERLRTLEETRAGLEQELRKQKAQKRLAELAENFSSLVFEQSGSLQPAADALKLGIQQSPWISKGGAPAVPELNNIRLLAAIFSEDVLKNKRNTEAIEAAPNTLVAARLLEFKPAAVKPFGEVSAQIAARLTREEADKLARKQGEAHLAELGKGVTPAGVAWSASQPVGRAQPGPVFGPVLDAVMRAPVGTLPAYVGADHPGGGYVLVRIDQVSEGKPADEAQRRAFADRLRQMAAQAEFSAYLAALREKTEVKVSRELLDKKADAR